MEPKDMPWTNLRFVLPSPDVYVTIEHVTCVQAHRFLETNGEALTVVAMRQLIDTIDIDRDHKMSLLEYAVFIYKTDTKVLMSRPQGVLLN